MPRCVRIRSRREMGQADGDPRSLHAAPRPIDKRAAMQFDQGFGERQAEPGAGMLARIGIVELAEDGEGARDIRFRHADAAIGDDDLGRRGAGRGADHDLPPRWA